MKRILIILITLGFTMNALSLYGEIKGIIRVDSEPGATVFLDGRKLGVTSIENDDYITRNSFGFHIIEIQKNAYRSQRFLIEVKAGEIVYVKVNPFAPGEKVVPLGEEGSSKL